MRQFLPPSLKHRARGCPIHLDIVARVDRFTCSMIYRGFPSKLHHDVPHWVEPNSLFHIRIRLDRDKQQTPLTDALLATTLLKSAELYASRFRWHIALFLLMPDHVHALLAFKRGRINEPCHWRLETFSLAKESHRMAGGLFRSSIARRRAPGATAGQGGLYPAKSCRSGPMREGRRVAMGNR